MKRASTFAELQRQWGRDPQRRQAQARAVSTFKEGLASGGFATTAEVRRSDWARAMRDLEPDDRDIFYCCMVYASLKGISGENPVSERELDAAQLAARVFNDPLEARKWLPALWTFIHADDALAAEITSAEALQLLILRPDMREVMERAFEMLQQKTSSAAIESARAKAFQRYLNDIRRNAEVAMSKQHWTDHTPADVVNLYFDAEGQIIGPRQRRRDLTERWSKLRASERGELTKQQDAIFEAVRARKNSAKKRGHGS